MADEQVEQPVTGNAGGDAEAARPRIVSAHQGRGVCVGDRGRGDRRRLDASTVGARKPRSWPRSWPPPSHGEAAEPRRARAQGRSRGARRHEHDLREVELGTYNVTRFNPATNTTLAIDFELFGTVLAEDATEFEHHFENSKARIREQVTMTLHGAESADLTDAGLGLIKRQILEKTNRALGEPLLKEVLFSKFNFVER